MKLINLELPKTGFRNFISSWIFEHHQNIFVVDPGPKNSLHHLISALKDRKPDYIILTHIHIDHAGGAGELHQLFPNAKFVCFSKAKKHLVSPEKLIQGSKSLARDLMQVYGEISPVNEISILEHDKLKLDGLEIIETPGHASHHISYLINENLFCGEALGVILNTDKGLYIRPATPPPFKKDIYIKSIKVLKRFCDKKIVKKLRFGHFGSLDYSDEIFEIALKQIELWVEVIKANPKNAFEALKKEDKNFGLFDSLPEDIQMRERIFIANSIAGVRGGQGMGK